MEKTTGSLLGVVANAMSVPKPEKHVLCAVRGPWDQGL
jgi:hypothetical protein